LARKQVGFSPRADYERERLYHCDNCGAEFFQDMEQRRSIHLYEEGVSGRYTYNAAEGRWEFRSFDRAKRKWTTRPLETQHERDHRPDEQKRKAGWLGWLSEMVRTILSPHIEDGQVYDVKAGDSLRKLADKFFDDPLAWPTIWKATNLKFAEDGSFALIADPNVIRAGQKLWIPNINRLEQLLTESDETESRIVGVFFEQSAGRCSILRFHKDGLVLNATLQIDGGVAQSWPRIKQWFHRENADPSHLSGQYRLISDHLSFFIVYEEGKVAYYAGTCLGDRLNLSSFSRKNREYVRLDIGECVFSQNEFSTL
jgi:hypothetical protein